MRLHEYVWIVLVHINVHLSYSLNVNHCSADTHSDNSFVFKFFSLVQTEKESAIVSGLSATSKIKLTATIISRIPKHFWGQFVSFYFVITLKFPPSPWRYYFFPFFMCVLSGFKIDFIISATVLENVLFLTRSRHLLMFWKVWNLSSNTEIISFYRGPGNT